MKEVSMKISLKETCLDWISICVLPLFVFVFYIPINNTYRLWISVAFVVLGFVLTFISRKHRESRDAHVINTKDGPSSDQFGKEYFERPEVILGTMYAIIAGFAFTEALKDYNQYIEHIPLCSPSSQIVLNRECISEVLNNADVIFRLLSFFAIAVPFYHGGILTLLKGEKRNIKY